MRSASSSAGSPCEHDGVGVERRSAASSRLVADALLDLEAQRLELVARAGGDRAGRSTNPGDADQLELGAERAGEVAPRWSSAAFASSEPS